METNIQWFVCCERLILRGEGRHIVSELKIALPEDLNGMLNEITQEPEADSTVPFEILRNWVADEFAGFNSTRLEWRLLNNE